MIAEGRALLEEAPHASLAPAAALFATVLSLNVIGERLRARDDTPAPDQRRVAVISSQ
jgi:peptide/nickel transport system permease protein